MIALKLDENLSDSLLSLARTRDFDAESVRTENLDGVADQSLFERCRDEGRVLVTLDLDFSDPIRFRPSRSAGTIVLRAGRPSMELIRVLFIEALDGCGTESPSRSIWIVEVGRVRIYRPWDDDE